MKVHILILVLLWVACLQVCLAQADYFKSFRLKYNRNYQPSETILRQQVFNKNMAKIEEHNKKYDKGLETYKLGVNQFADLTEEEYSSKFKTWQIIQKSTRLQQDNISQLKADDLPNNVDWRTAGIVTPVKNQGDCLGCWAFGATGTLEGQLALSSKNLISLSEQELLDCSTSNKGCAGGLVQLAIDYVAKNGITSENQYPYYASQGVCTKNKPVVAIAKGYTFIHGYNETDLKLAVAKIGPISVAVNANPFQFYSSGIFNSTYSECNDKVNHAVLAVGYGTVSTTGAQYWILKNSWGALWGESGYYRMAMGVGTGLCGIARQACYPYGVTNSTSEDGGDGGGSGGGGACYSYGVTNNSAGRGGAGVANTLSLNSFVSILGVLVVAIRIL